MRDDLERLADISIAIDKILSKTAQDRSAFERDEMLQVWVLHHLQIVGEAARCLSEEFRRLHPNPVWSKAAGMRHILVHHYFEIDAAQVWKVVERDLQPLRELVRAILGSVGSCGFDNAR
ncbi:MAG: HepT-like ribonuclease domain-containing protein [Bryobacteraceae bacterium]